MVGSAAEIENPPKCAEPAERRAAGSHGARASPLLLQGAEDETGDPQAARCTCCLEPPGGRDTSFPFNLLQGDPGNRRPPSRTSVPAG